MGVIFLYNIYNFLGWWLFLIYVKIKHVPNHQPAGFEVQSPLQPLLWEALKECKCLFLSRTIFQDLRTSSPHFRKTHIATVNAKIICVTDLLDPAYQSWVVLIGSMHAIYGNIYHQYTLNVSIYTSTMDPSWGMNPIRSPKKGRKKVGNHWNLTIHPRAFPLSCRRFRKKTSLGWNQLESGPASQWLLLTRALISTLWVTMFGSSCLASISSNKAKTCKVMQGGAPPVLLVGLKKHTNTTSCHYPKPSEIQHIELY